MPRDRRADEDDEVDERRPPRRRTADYEDEDDAPRRARRRDEDDQDDERRPRRAPREQDPGEAPTRRVRRDEEADADDPPRRSRRAEPDGEAEDGAYRDRRARREQDEQNTEERPRRRAGRDEAEQANRGWGAAKAAMEESSAFAKALKPTEKAVVIKCLEDDPFDAFASHWLERQGKRKFRCRGKAKCPLCDPFGDQPNSSTLHFNVVSFADPDVPTFEFLEAGARLGRLLEDLADDQRFSGLSDPRLYLAISMTKGGDSKKAVPKVEVIKERDLFDDWDIEPLTDKQLREFEHKCYDRPVDPVPTVEEMRAIIRELTR